MSEDIFDVFRPFVEKGLRLTRRQGFFGMVLPDIVLLKDYESTRRLLLEKLAMTHLDWWGKVFEDAEIDVATITGRKESPEVGHRVAVEVHGEDKRLRHEIVQSTFWKNDRLTFNLHLTEGKRSVLATVKQCPKLGDCFEAHEGVHSGNIRDELFVEKKLDGTCRRRSRTRSSSSRKRAPPGSTTCGGRETWRLSSPGPTLHAFAPYAAHVLRVELFLIAGLASGQISSARPSNRIDLAYLHYLPFCMMFVSGDNLHRRTAPFLLRPDQQMLWGPDFKAGLRELDDHYKSLPVEVREQGIFAFAPEPPHDDRMLIPRIWDGFFPGWRSKPKRPPMSEEEQRKLVAQLKAMQAGDGGPLRAKVGDEPEPDYLFTQHRVRKKRGSWYQVPKDMKEEEEAG